MSVVACVECGLSQVGGSGLSRSMRQRTLVRFSLNLSDGLVLLLLPLGFVSAVFSEGLS